MSYNFLDRSINVKKSSCIRIGNRHNVTCASITTCYGQPLHWVSEFRYLGVFTIQPQIRLINVDKTKVMASDGIACRILIQNELLEQVDTFPYLGSLITEDGECTTEFRTRLNRGQAIEASL